MIHSGPVPWRTRAWAALLSAGRGAALSHDAAAFLDGFRPTPPREIHVSIPESRRVSPNLGVVLHRRTVMPATVGRPRRVWRADTAVDLVEAALSDDDAVGHLCAAVRAGCSVGEIRDALAHRSRVRRARLFADLLAEVTEGIESPLERRYHRDVERKHGLPRARLQVRQVVDGTWIRADRLYEGLGVRIELDGALAHPGGRTDRDTWRDNAVMIEKRELTLRYRWRHVAVVTCATASQVLAALRIGGADVPGHPCSPGCPVR